MVRQSYIFFYYLLQCFLFVYHNLNSEQELPLLPPPLIYVQTSLQLDTLILTNTITQLQTPLMRILKLAKQDVPYAQPTDLKSRRKRCAERCSELVVFKRSHSATLWTALQITPDSYFYIQNDKSSCRIWNLLKLRRSKYFWYNFTVS